MKAPLPPKTKDILVERVRDLAGLSIAQCASKFSLQVPASQRQQKGFIGQLMERALGTDASNLPVPDFTKLGIELKTLPIGVNGKPAESTFVASINLQNFRLETWDTSIVKRKLSHVLWLPIEASRDIELAQRRIGLGFLWKPSKEQARILSTDWQEFNDLITLGKLESINASFGDYLQIRPKAQDGRALCTGFDSEGNSIKTLPRGFYLRASFTNTLINCS